MSVEQYHPSEEKEYIRNLVFLFFVNTTKVLTLPNLHFELETLLLKDGKEVHCCEKVQHIYQKQCVIAPENVKLHYGDIKTLDLGQYDGLFLDFCGYWNKDTSEILSKIKKGAYVVLTFMMNRESKTAQKLIDINKREESYVRLLATFGIQVEKFATYGSFRSPMAVFMGRKLI